MSEKGKLSKIMTMMCVRNTYLEELHAGVSPVSYAGDYSDVKVIDADGREIPWNELSRLNDDEMKKLMQQVVSRIFTFNVLADDELFHKALSLWKEVADKWDDPEMDRGFLSMIERQRVSDAEH